MGHEGKHTAFLACPFSSQNVRPRQNRREIPSHIRRGNAQLSSGCSPESFSSLVLKFVLVSVRFHPHRVRVAFFFSSSLLKLILLLLLLLLTLPVLFYFGKSGERIPVFKVCLLIPIFREIIVSCLHDS